MSEVRLLLVHEAWHGTWMWNPLVPILERAGYTIDALELPGVADGRSATLRDQGQALSKQLRDRAEPAVVVAYGFAGLVVQRAALHAGDRMAGVIGIDLVTAQPGQSGWSIMTAPDAEPALTSMCTEPSRRALPPPPTVAATLPEEIRLLLADHLTTQALDTFTEPCHGLDLAAAGLLLGGVVSRRPWTESAPTSTPRANFETVGSAHELLLSRPDDFATMLERHLAVRTLRPAA